LLRKYIAPNASNVIAVAVTAIGTVGKPAPPVAFAGVVFDVVVISLGAVGVKMLLVSACGVLEKVLFSVSLEEFVGATNDDVEEVKVPLFEVTVVSVVVVGMPLVKVVLVLIFVVVLVVVSVVDIVLESVSISPVVGLEVVALVMNPVAEVVVAPDDEVKVMIVGVLVLVVDVVGVVGFRVVVVVASVGSIFKVVVVDVLGGPEMVEVIVMLVVVVVILVVGGDGGGEGLTIKILNMILLLKYN